MFCCFVWICWKFVFFPISNLHIMSRATSFNSIRHVGAPSDPHILTDPLKVAFIQKVLIYLSFPQTDKPDYFPELGLWNFKISKGSNHVKKGTEVPLKARLGLHLATYSNPSKINQTLIWPDLSPLEYQKFKIQAQENN